MSKTLTPFTQADIHPTAVKVSERVEDLLALTTFEVAKDASVQKTKALTVRPTAFGPRTLPVYCSRIDLEVINFSQGYAGWDSGRNSIRDRTRDTAQGVLIPFIPV